MRFRAFAAVIVAVLMLSVGLSSPASAFGWKRHHAPHGWDRSRVVRRGDYRPRYTHRHYVNQRTDSYTYRYQTRGYYPYYNSNYWRPSRQVPYSRRFRAPRYHPAWGIRKRHWQNRRWHARHHGGHPFWMW